jgi:serine/threonine-protein kinase
MDSARWERVQAIFHQAVGRPEPDRRSFLETECAGDAALMAEILTMLAADGGNGSVLDRGLGSLAYESLAASPEGAPSQELGPYRLIRILGEGGMGVVWLAERRDVGNLVALKFLLHAGLSPARRERFAMEIRTLGKLRHPYIARLYDAGTLVDGTPWFVMEYVEGVPLTEYCRQPGRSMEDQVRLFRRVCEAVQYAHGQEIIHRDLKPSNIMVAADGTPRLLDFGIARELQQVDHAAQLTRPGLRFMSPDYAAPEWAHDGVVGLYTDVYSLGVILYEILAGQLPFERAQRAATRLDETPAHKHPERPSVVAARLGSSEQGKSSASKLSRATWSELDVLCLKAMHRDAADRYASVEALLRDVDHFLKMEPLEARPDSLSYRVGKFVRRHRGAVLATSAASCLAVCLIVLFTVRLAKARDTALIEAARAKHIQQFMLNLFQGGDKDAGPADDLRVVALIDRGVQEARSLSAEPEAQADLYETLGAMDEKLGRLDRASPLLALSLHEREALPHPDQTAVAENLIALGLLRSDQGQSNEAEHLVYEARAAIQKQEPRNRALLASAEFAAGSVLVDAGQYEQAIEPLNKAIAIQAVESAPSSDLARTLTVLGDADLYLGHFQVAYSVYERALTIDRAIYGDHHPSVSDDLHDMAQVQEMWGHYAEAERYERQALQIAEGWYGKDHPDAARKMTTLAGTLIYEGKYPEANGLLQHALAIQTHAYGPMHPHVAYVLNLLGSVANEDRRFNDAEADYLRMAAIYRSAYGNNDYRVSIAMTNLAGVYQNEKRYPAAERVLRTAVRQETAEFSANNINTAITEIKLGRLLLEERRYREAEAQTRAGYEVLLKQTSASTSFVQGARHDLAVIYAALGEPRQAHEFREQNAIAGNRN